MDISCVVFDFDNTLVPTYAERRQLFLETLREWTPMLTEELLDSCWTTSFREVVRTCAPGADYETFVARYEARIRSTPVAPSPCAASLLDELSKARVPCGVFTASSRRLVEADLEGSGLTPFILFIVSSDNSEYGKPDPKSIDALLGALLQLGVEPPQTLYVGDSVSDAELARLATMRFVAVTTGRYGHDDFTRADVPASDIFADLCELGKWLSRFDRCS